MGKTKNKFYVVWEGVNPGIYSSWEICKKQVHGFENAKYKSFESREEAEKAYQSSYWDFAGNSTPKSSKIISPEVIARYGEPVKESLSVDAACSGNPGLMEYRGVYTKTGEEVFKVGPFEDGTNNIGEFLALVHGIAILKQKQLSMPVYSDSKTAIAWLKNKKSKTNLEKTGKNEKIFDLLQRAEKWLNENDYKTEVLKWHTEVWGEIPADFGRK